MKLNLPQQIKSDRLLLKKHTLDKKYIQMLVDSINQNRKWLGQFLPYFDEQITFEKEEAFIKMLMTEEKEISYGIWNKKTNELMGTIGIFNPDNAEKPKTIELALMLFEKYTGNHYGPEATEVLENVLFQKGLESVSLKIQKENTRSLKAAEDRGHIYDGCEKGTDNNKQNLEMLIYKKFSNRGK